MRTSWNRLIFTIGLFTAAPAVAQNSMSGIQFGPHVGGGTVSTGAEVRHTTGMRGSYYYGVARLGAWHLAPEVELGMNLLTSRDSDGASKEIGNFEHRQIGLGMRVVRSFGSKVDSPEVFAKISGGAVSSNVRFDQSGADTFVKTELEGIRGSYIATEIGTSWILQDNLAVTGGLLFSRLQLDQTGVSGKQTTEQDSATGLLLTERNVNREDLQLGEYSQQSTVAASAGLQLRF